MAINSRVYGIERCFMTWEHFSPHVIKMRFQKTFSSEKGYKLGGFVTSLKRRPRQVFMMKIVWLLKSDRF